MQRASWFSNLAAAVILLAANAALGQSTPPSRISASNDTGVQPYGSYAGARENVNLSNGNLNIEIPLLSIPGRNGNNLTLSLQYDSKNWTLSHAYDPILNKDIYDWRVERRLPQVGGIGWHYNIPLLSGGDGYYDDNQNFHYLPYIVSLPDGSKHSLRNPAQAPDQYIIDAEDTSYLRLLATNPIVVITKSGTRYYFDNCSTIGGAECPATRIVDTNGNSIQFAGTTWTDTVGRTVSKSSQTNQDVITYTDSNGQTQTITIHLIDFSTSASFTCPQANGLTVVHLFNQGSKIPDSVSLPGGLTYTFQHNAFGELTRVTYPTGGYTQYDYAAYQHTEDFGNGDSVGADFRELTAKHVCAATSCSNGTEDTTYTPTVADGDFNNEKVDVVNGEGDKSTHFFNQVGATPYARAEEIATEFRSADGTLLKRVDRVFDTGYDRLPGLLRTVRTTLYVGDSGAVTKEQQIDYDTYTARVFGPPTYVPDYQTYQQVSRYIDNPVEVREYDFGTPGSGTAGSLLRKTTNTWLKTNPINSVDYASLHIMDRKLSEQVYDENGTKRSETQFEYDKFNYSYTGFPASMAASQASVGRETGFSTSYTTRGNLTRISRWRDLPSSKMLDTAMAYDDAGNIVATRDPGGHVTTFGYTDAWAQGSCSPTGQSAAYLTSISNAVSLTVSGAYNSCFGTVGYVRDENQQGADSQHRTDYLYDALGRLTQTTLPPDDHNARAQTTISYTTNTRTTISPLDGTRTLTTTETVDGVGRVTRTAVTNPVAECSGGTVYVDTSYDRASRKKTLTNPYCSTSDATYGVTTYQVYDGLGRLKSLQHPDGSTATTTYGGRATEAVDEGNGNGSNKVKRVSQVDGLGRLKSVCEVTSAALPVGTESPSACGQDLGRTGFLTTYDYDLGNLKAVHQGALQQRTFTYDSLSRLLTAFNPEAGTTSYDYDDDGLVLHRTRPAPNQTGSATVVTTYSYDAIHRQQTVSYNDGSTPSVEFGYDEDTYNSISLQKPKGRLTHSAVLDGSAKEILSYDELGRIRNDRQYTPYNASGSPWLLTYDYDLAGNIISATNGVGVTFTSHFNNGGRLDSLTSSLVDANHPATLLSAVQYSAAGALIASAYGNGVSRSVTLNPRLLPTNITDYAPTFATSGSGTVTLSGSERSTQVGGAAGTSGTGWLSFSGSEQSRQVQTQPATSGTGNVSISGSEQSTQVLTQAATPATGTATITGSERSGRFDCDPRCVTIYDSGSVTIYVNGYSQSAAYGNGSTTTSIASALASAFNNDGNSPVTASLSASTITFTTKQAGGAVNYSFSQVSDTSRPDYFSGSSFSANLSGSTLTGGQNAIYTTVYDAGTVSIGVNGYWKSTSYGQGSSTSSVAAALATAFNGDGGSPVSASSSGATVYFTARTTGAGTNYALASSYITSQGQYFGSSSFWTSNSGGWLTGGQDAQYTTQYDAGTAYITVNGHTNTTGYGQGSTASGIASAIASAINGDGGAPVTASPSGSTVYVTAKSTGASTNYSLSASVSSGQGFSPASFGSSVSGGNLTGGSDPAPPTTVYDTGTVSVIVNGFAKSTAYGQNSTPSSLAIALRDAFNGDGASPVNASVSGSQITLTAKTTGAATNYSLTTSAGTNSGYFSGTSFSGSPSGSNLTGGADAGSRTVYSVGLSYAPNGSVTGANDSVNGKWIYSYDDFNRLITGVASNVGKGCSWDYDRYGNRWHQNNYNGTCYATTSLPSSLGTNRIDPGYATYDAAGNVLNDGVHSYTYDAENRLKTVDGTTTYKYDASGRRIKRATPSENVEYIYDLQGRAVSVVNSAGTWVRGEIFAGNLHVATYVNGTTEFSHSDWLGTERVRTNVSASGDQYFTGYPFGEENSGGNSPLHFTSKEVDSESSLSYFGARYYRSASGRFSSPDWSAEPTSVPYADFENPQSLNLYAYMKNRALSGIDADGHLSAEEDGWGYHGHDSGSDFILHAGFGGIPPDDSAVWKITTLNADGSLSAQLLATGEIVLRASDQPQTTDGLTGRALHETIWEAVAVNKKGQLGRVGNVEIILQEKVLSGHVDACIPFCTNRQEVNKTVNFPPDYRDGLFSDVKSTRNTGNFSVKQTFVVSGHNQWHYAKLFRPVQGTGASLAGNANIVTATAQHIYNKLVP